MKRYQDLADLTEDDRIAKIAKAVKCGNTVGFIVDDEPGKPERYIEKLKKLVPNVIIVGKGKGPVAGSVAVRVKQTVNN